jgi:hypothetical protein
VSDPAVSKKVTEQDIPKILVAIKNGVDSKQSWTLTIKGSDNGGIIDIRLVKEQSFK